MVDAIELQKSRVDEAYIVNQVKSVQEMAYWSEHKSRIADFFRYYSGDFSGLVPSGEENTLPNVPYIENKLKNSTHDITRLTTEAKGMPVFVKDGESEAAATRARVRAGITDTIWRFAKGPDVEKKFYMDLISGGMAAASIFKNSKSDYPQLQRLAPMYCYPDVYNDVLQDMLYVETIKERVAARLFPDLGLREDAKENDEVFSVIYFSYDEVIQAVVKKGKSGQASSGVITDRWVHGLDCVPIAFVQLDTADGQFRGLLDQLPGPLMARNRTTRLVIDYLEQMVNSPFEERGIEQPIEMPGPTTVYHHDESIEGPTFIRRVGPAAPAGAVFGLLQYLGAEEAVEAVQPPARVGTVRQSIASGSFVESTQGSLSSTVRDLQNLVGRLRVQIDTVALKIDEKYLDFPKPLWRAVGNKKMYTPTEDIKGWYHHEIQYGAAAGLDRREADNRVLQHLGAGLIDKGMARGQIDYIDTDSNIQDDIDRELLSQIFFQRFAGDSNTPLSLLATTISEMSDGKSLSEAIRTIAPQLVEYEQQQREAGVAGAPTQPEAVAGAPAETAALEAGATQEVPAQEEQLDITEFQPPPLTQIFAGGA